MIEKRFKGFIAHMVDYSDNDAIVNVITEDKKETFKARSIKKITSKNASSCNYFMLSEFIVTSKSEVSNQTLKTSSLIKLYKRPFEDLLASSSFLYIGSILNMTSSQINGYNLAIKCFDLIEENENPINVLNYFLKHLCKGLGFEILLDGCVSCNKKDNLISFDFEAGGFICKNCFNNKLYETLPTNFLASIYKIMKNEEYEVIEDNHAIRLFKMYNKFLSEVVGINVDEYEFILKCL